MNLYSGDCPYMANQISRGILTEASFRAVSEACPSDESLAAKVSEHAAQVYFRPLFCFPLISSKCLAHFLPY